MSATSQYMQANRDIQGSMMSAMEELTSKLFSVDASFNPSAPTVDLHKVVDEVFGLYRKGLDAQRDAIHQAITANDELLTTWREQTEQVQGVLRDQAKALFDLQREQIEKFSGAAREQAIAFGESAERQTKQAKDAVDKQVLDLRGATESAVDSATDNAKSASDKAATEAEKAAKAAAR